MTMQSSNLLQALRELPGGDGTGQRLSFRENITSIVNMDRAMYAAEFSAGVSFGMWFVFDEQSLLGIDIPGTAIDGSYLQAAYERIDIYNPDMNVVEFWQIAMDDGSRSLGEFSNKLKGIVGEFQARDQLNELGYDLQLAKSNFQGGWDLEGFDPEGEYVQIQVKVGDSERQVEKTLEAMKETDYPFVLSEDIYERVLEEAPELADRVVAVISSDYELIGGIQEGLETLSNAMDIGDAIPGVTAIAGGARLIMGALKTKREFKSADRTTKNKMHVIQTLTLMSRVGITAALAKLGSMGGGALGTAVPGVGNLVGLAGGGLLGAGVGMYLNRHLQPHMLNLALNITGLTNDDLFYYKNKPRIDSVALSISQQAGALAAPA